MIWFGVSRESRSIGCFVPKHALGRLLLAVSLLTCLPAEVLAQATLQCGMHRVDVTPDVDGDRPVWLAGYGWGRRATGVHDPLYATCVALSDGTKRLALVTIDVVGLQLPTVEEVRNQLKNFDYVLISSTHNHEGPDTIGIWGNTPVQRGVDDAYLDRVVKQIVEGVRQAEARLQPVRAAYGTATDETLLGDSRKPQAKDGILRVLRMEHVDDGKLIGLIVQWNCHPEAMGPHNTLVTADFPWATIDRLQNEFGCPIAYFTGAIGGLMAPPDGVIRDEHGKLLEEGDFEYARCYGLAVAELASRAVRDAQPITLVPFRLNSQNVAMPVQNSLYRTASLLGIVRRPRTAWTGDYRSIQPITRPMLPSEMAIVTEVAYLRLGELSMAAIPGELYPELVYGQFQEPVEPNVDFPDAALEKTIVQLLPDERWMLFGLANDEIGYIIPQRQWDQAPPFAYGRDKAQYGEVNSCGPDVAPIVMRALADCIQNTAEP